MKQKLTAYHLSMIAFSVVLNLIGGQLALLLRLPIYLDSIGTIFSAALLGPFYGMFPSLLSGVILGMTSDIYSLYYFVRFPCRACLEAENGQNLVAFCGGFDHNDPRIVCKLLHYGLSVWRYHFFGIHYPGAAACKNTAGADHELFRGAGDHRLSGSHSRFFHCHAVFEEHAGPFEKKSGKIMIKSRNFRLFF